MSAGQLLCRRLVKDACRCIFRGIKRTNITCNIEEREIHISAYSAMAQRSITSFFKISPPKTAEKLKETDVKEEKPTVKSLCTNGTDKRSSKRPRLDSSGSEPETAKTVSPKDASVNKKKPKRQRIESSGSEADLPAHNQASPKPVVKSSLSCSESSPKSDAGSSPKLTKKTSPKPLKVKVENADSPKMYASPKSKKGKKETKSNKSVSSESPPSKSKKVKKEVLSNGEVSKDVKENIDVKTETADDDGSKEVVPVSETEYNPAKVKYHPIGDACWAAGRPVPYMALAKTFEAIEPTSARLKIIEILSNYFRSVTVLTPEDLLPSVYMCLNRLAPAYHSLELGIAETYLMKAVGSCTGRSLAQLRAAAEGAELGALAERARAAQRTMFPQPPLTVRYVFAHFKEIARMTGQASVNKKIAKIQSLYIASRRCEAKYLIRSLEGKLRIGLAEQSVLQALALATATTPPGPTPTPSTTPVLDASRGMSPENFKARVDEYSLIIKTTYCECPNYDAIIPALLKYGVPQLPEHCRLSVGVPLKPMLAHPTRGVHEVFNRFEGEEFTCEWKYDGERAQIHVPGDDKPDFENASIYSRNQENNTSKYPDVLRRLPTLLKPSVSSCVLDCEAVAYHTENKQILPFQILSTRKRKDAVEADIEVQVCVFVFDVLFLNGRALVREPLVERRRLLREHFTETEGEWQWATSRDCADTEEMQQFLEEAVRGSCEGLMVKALRGPSARYDIARRSHNWLKLKKDYLEGVGDTLDVVIIGAYFGRGKRRGRYGGFLAACRDAGSDTYQALCKLGTGFGDDQLAAFTDHLRPLEIPHPKTYYSYDGSHTPDAWFPPSAVWEVRCADLSLSPAHRAAIGLVDPHKGISLRFPRFVRVRSDKSPEQATSAQQVAQLYLAQDQVRNCAAKHTTYHADDFY